MEDYRHILFIKPSSLGDIVQAMPTCAAIHRAYPKARLTWLVKREWAGFVERIDGVDQTERPIIGPLLPDRKKGRWLSPPALADD